MEHDLVVITDDGKVIDHVESRVSRLVRQMAKEIAEEEDVEIFRILERQKSSNKDI